VPNGVIFRRGSNVHMILLKIKKVVIFYWQTVSSVLLTEMLIEAE